jgi:serine/threonine-protein kinase
MRTHLGPFQILEMVGRGGMGTVYRGLDPIIGRAVAVKVIRLVGYNDAEEQEWLKTRLFREARAAGSLCHPGIVTIYQVGEENDLAYIAMEFVDGPSLHDILAKEGPRDKAKLCRILLETAAALDYAHERGLVHRDIKPANIMVNATGATKVTDFGIAKTMLGQTATKTGMILGTPFYMSPEQIRGKVLDGRSDQFSLAVVAYEIFTGRKPFQAEQLTSVCYQIIHEEPLCPDRIDPRIGSETAAVIQRALSKNPDARYRTCVEFVTELTAAFDRAQKGRAQQDAITTEGMPPGPTGARPRRMGKAVLWFSIAVGTLIAGGWALLPQQAPVRPAESSPIPGKAAPPAETNRAPAPETARSGGDIPPGARHLSGRPATQKMERAELSERERRIAEKPPVSAEMARRDRPETMAIEGAAAPLPEQTAMPQPRQMHSARSIPPPERAVRKGMLVWTGYAASGDVLTITATHASKGSVSGTFPGRGASIAVHPAALTRNGLIVFTANPGHLRSPVVPTPHGRATFTFDPRHATDLTVFEAPHAQNDWGRLLIRVNRPLSACVIEWAH